MKITEIGICEACGFELQAFERDPTTDCQGRVDISANSECSTCLEIAKAVIEEFRAAKAREYDRVSPARVQEGPSLPEQERRPK